eukprot:scaffold6614_cov51-Attheya_sp.AAC.6
MSRKGCGARTTSWDYDQGDDRHRRKKTNFPDVPVRNFIPPQLSPLTREKTPKVAVSRELKLDSLPEKSMYRRTVPDSFGAVHDLSQYVGRVGLVVNMASE